MLVIPGHTRATSFQNMAVKLNFKVYLCRGVDAFRHNPYGKPPVQRYGRPDFKPVSNEEAGKG